MFNVQISLFEYQDLTGNVYLVIWRSKHMYHISVAAQYLRCHPPVKLMCRYHLYVAAQYIRRHPKVLIVYNVYNTSILSCYIYMCESSHVYTIMNTFCATYDKDA